MSRVKTLMQNEELKNNLRITYIILTKKIIKIILKNKKYGLFKIYISF